jgi:hypothetical protein
MEFEVLPRETHQEREMRRFNPFRTLLNEQTKAVLESQPPITDPDDEPWYEAASEACIAAGLGWNGPAVQRWVVKKLSNETNS